MSKFKLFRYKDLYDHVLFNYQWLYAKMCAVPLPEVLGGSVTIPGVPVPHFRKYGFVDFPVYSTYQTCSVVIENFSVGFPLYH